eukprot:PITA_04947
MERREEITWSRWTPTKRQKEILEDLFRQGHRNPSRSRINEITTLLKQHGKVDAKNVFYWFQNTQARSKRKQKMENRPQRRSRFESTPQVLNEKDTVKNVEVQICPSPTKADRMIEDYSKDVAEFSAQITVQETTNSPESTSSTSTQKLIPIDLSWKHHLQSVRAETFSEPDHFTYNMWNKEAYGKDGWLHHFTDPRRSNVMKNCAAAQEHEKKEELLELFPLHPDGNLRSKCNRSLDGKQQTNNMKLGGGVLLSLKFVP